MTFEWTASGGQIGSVTMGDRDEFITTNRDGYSHWVTAYVEAGKCDVCQQGRQVLRIDTSDGKYTDLKICQPCIAQRFVRSEGIK